MQEKKPDKGGGIELVLVPRHPTKEMIDAAWAAATAENADGVWNAMIECWFQANNGNSSSGSP